VSPGPAAESDRPGLDERFDRLVGDPALDVGGKGGGGQVTVLGAKRHRLQADRFQGRRDGLVAGSGWREFGFLDLFEEIDDRHLAERGLAGQQRVEGRAQAEDVGAGAELLQFTGGLLGAHERGRSHHRADHRHRSVASRQGTKRLEFRLGGRVGLVQGLGQTPVDDQGLAVAAEHHVVGLDVAMENPSAVRVVDGVADGDEPGEELVERQGVAERRRVLDLVRLLELLDRGLEAVAADEPHRVVRSAVGIAAQAVDRDNSGVFEPSGDLGLENEPELAIGLASMSFLDLLQRHLAVQLGVDGDVDLAQATPGVEPDRPESRRSRLEP
jgi:hypothetical protein